MAMNFIFQPINNGFIHTRSQSLFDNADKRPLFTSVRLSLRRGLPTNPPPSSSPLLRRTHRALAAHFNFAYVFVIRWGAKGNSQRRQHTEKPRRERGEERSEFRRLPQAPFRQQMLSPVGWWLPLLAVVTAEIMLWRSKGCKDEKGDCFCSGTYNARTMAGSDNRIEDLRVMYKGCKRVYGNLEITHLTNSTLSSKYNSSIFKKDLGIFDEIEEIKGYLLIYNVDLQILNFPKLKIIWGDDLMEENEKKEGAGLMISSNHNLKEIRMPSLKSIARGLVRIENNTFLCHLRSKVNWNELLDLQADTRLRRTKSAHRQCDQADGTPKEFCPAECTSGYCWGSKKGCQELYREVCPQYCFSHQCYLDQSEPGKQEFKCCHDTCEGGCTGPTAKDCVACKELSLDGECVSKCPPLKVQDRKRGMLVPNPNGTYVHDRYCVKECPQQLLIEGETCVRHCSEGSHHDMTKDSRECKPCNGPCPKVCRVNSPLTGSLLKTLKDCDEIDGFIEIQETRMTGSDGFSRTDLDVLKSVRMISEYVSMATQVHSPLSMDFLRNLEFIEGRSLATQRHALVVTKNDNLRYLGLRNLHTIKAGNVVITMNHNLCLADSVNWTKIITPKAAAKVDHNVRIEKCIDRGYVCDSECDPGSGCWGKGPEMCMACRTWSKNGTCVPKCPTTGFYEDLATRECKPCYEQCKQCRGPSEAECLSCKNVTLMDNEFRTCLPECPVTHFEANRECFKCHDSCLKHGCTGPGNHLGPNGCNRCEYAVVQDGKVDHCLHTDGPQHQVCIANGLTNYHASTVPVDGVELVHCEKCNDECVTCTSGGQSFESNGCVCKNFRVMLKDSTSFCTDECKKNSYLISEKTATSYGTCGRCSELCDQNDGCTGPSEFECIKCAVAAVAVNGTMECRDECPEDAPFLSERDKFCRDTDVDKAERQKRLIILSTVVLAFIILFISVVCIIFRCTQIKKKLRKVETENYADIPEMKPIEPGVEPNLNKINMIPTSDLHTKSIRLGEGAFGIVYAGYWYPRGKGKLKVPVAIKVVKATGTIRGKEETTMVEEAAKMAQMQHEHLLRLVGICMNDDGIMLVTLLRPLGNLLNFLRQHREHLSAKDLLLYCYQISSAMKYLYKHRLVHRDLAARNVLVKKANHVEVTDFGLAKMLSYGENEVVVNQGKVPIKWLAPECRIEHVFNHATDVWAFGVTCWEILTFGEVPYRGMDQDHLTQFLKDGNRLAQPNNCTTELYQVLLQCWMTYPDSRPSFVMLYERFKEFCQVPHLYVGDLKSQSSFDMDDQRHLLREILSEQSVEWDDVADPLHYFDTNHQDESGSQCQPRNVRRHTSTSSHRYQSDPMGRPSTSGLSESSQPLLGTNRPSEIDFDPGNYLIPDSKLQEHQATLYTPVVVSENGGHEYYNDLKNNDKSHDYYNDVNSTPQSNALRCIQEESETMEKESCM